VKLKKAVFTAWVGVAITLASACSVVGPDANPGARSTVAITATSPAAVKAETATSVPTTAPVATRSATMPPESPSFPWTLLKLPDTGQVKDYTAVFGEDADYNINSPAYRDNGDGTVTDQVTGLVWQKLDGGEMIFENAAGYCQKLNLAGQSDWRLPSTQELFSIEDSDRNPALNPAFFPDNQAEYWWTSQKLAGEANKVWVVNAGGGIGAHPKDETVSAGGAKRFHTRCVRGLPVSLPGQLSANGDGTVSDKHTGLTWQQAEAPSAVTWEAALNTCENLSLGSHADWRLPNLKELRSISDDTRVRPSMDRSFFPGAQAARYWTSTTLFGRVGFAWFVDFTNGLASYNDKSGSLSVRCVRGG
jgi:hypothetical protein